MDNVKSLMVAAACLGLCGNAGGAQATWTLGETLRIGGAETGPLSFLYTKSIEADAKGQVFVLDRKTQDIRVFGPDGKLVRVIGRVGSGPGELRDAEGLIIARNGVLWVRDAANARFSLFSPEGAFQSSWTAKFCWSQGAWSPQPDKQGRIIDWDCAAGPGRERQNLVLAYRTDKSRVDTLGAMPSCAQPGLNEAGTWITRTERSTSYRTIPFAPRSQSVLGPDGETWCVPSSARYEILRLKAMARDTVRIVRSLPRVMVTQVERDSIIADTESKGPTGLDFSRIPKEKPAIDRLTVDDQGRLWVSRTTATGALAHDIFSSNGRIIATAELRGCRTSVWLPFVVRRDNVYTVCLDEDDVQFVTRFRLRRAR